MILVWGPSDDPPIQRMVAVLRSRGLEFASLDLPDLATLRYDVTLGARPEGWIELGGRRVGIDELSGIYLRPGEVPPGRATVASAALLGIASCAACAVVNHPSAGRSNWSKPLQSRLIAGAGLPVPDTLVTTDPAAARAFLAEHGRVVYKSISGVRSIVATLDGSGADRLDGVATGPVQFQRWIDGEDVRAHIVGDRWFATAVESEADDYRYAMREGAEVSLSARDIPRDLGRRLVALTRRMGLLVSGIDLRSTPDGRWFCFEVNPSPGFTYYEEATGQPIADAIADLLAGALSAGRGARSRSRRA